MIRAAVLILSGNLGSAAALMLRTLLVSRLISVEDFGIASCFVLALALVEMVTALGLQQQITQSVRGDDPDFQAALHGVSILRGAVAAVVLLALAHPLAWFFDVPQALWAFQLIAILPLLAGFTHLDPQRLSRGGRFAPCAIVGVLPPLLSLAAVWPLYLAFGDYRVLLFSIMIQMVLGPLMSHLMAQRRYRIRVDAEIRRSTIRFGAPIMLSGALMFLVFNGERAIIGNALGLEELALFSLAMSLTLTPALVMSRSMANLFLPRLAGARHSAEYQTLLLANMRSHLLLGVGLVAAVAIFGGPFVNWAVGPKYEAAIPLLTGLALLQSFRVFEGGCAIAALAVGRTMNEVFANLVRVALLPVAWIIVADGGGVADVILIGTVGEAGGFAIGLALLVRQQKPPLKPLLGSLALAAMSLTVVYCLAGQIDWQTGAALMALGALAVLAKYALIEPVRTRDFAGKACPKATHRG